MEHANEAKADCVLLGKTAHALSIALHEDEIIRIMLDQVMEIFSARAAVVCLVSADGSELILSGASGLSEGYLGKGPIKIAQSEVDRRVLAGEVVAIPDVGSMAGFCFAEMALREGLRGMVAAPLSVRDRVIGVFRVYVDEVEKLAAEDLALLDILGDLGAIALERVRLYQALYRIAEALNSSLELQPMLQRVLEAAVQKMGLKGASIRLWSNRDQILHLAASFGLSATYLEKGVVQLSRSPIDRRVMDGETVLLYDLETESALQYPQEAAREGIRSVLAVPLKLKERTLGVLRVYSARPRHYTPVDVKFVTSVADLVALGIENSRLFAALRAQYEDLKVDLADWYKFLALG